MREIISLRPVTDNDSALLEKVYADSRDWEFRGVYMPPEQKAAFLKQQFEAQDNAYKASFKAALHRIIQLKGSDIGRLIINRRDDALHIIDIAILAPYRGRGFGSDILSELKKEAQGDYVPVELKVAQNNPAMNLYLREGFEKIDLIGHHISMKWSPKIN